MKSGPTIGRTAVCGLALASAEVTRFGVVPRNIPVAQLTALLGVTNLHLGQLRAQLTVGAVLPLFSDSDELVAGDEEDLFGHVLLSSCCPRYYHNILDTSSVYSRPKTPPNTGIY